MARDVCDALVPAADRAWVDGRAGRLPAQAEHELAKLPIRKAEPMTALECEASA